MHPYRSGRDFRGTSIDRSAEQRRLRSIIRKTAIAIRNSHKILRQTNILLERSAILIARMEHSVYRFEMPKNPPRAMPGTIGPPGHTTSGYPSDGNHPPPEP